MQQGKNNVHNIVMHDLVMGFQQLSLCFWQEILICVTRKDL